MPNCPLKGEALAAAVSIPIRNSEPSRISAAARTFFLTSSIAKKRNLLQSDRSATLFIRTLYQYRAQGRFRLHEFVVMPDHFHLLITVDCNMTIERAVQFVKGGVRISRRTRVRVARQSGKKDSQRYGLSMRKGFWE